MTQTNFLYEKNYLTDQLDQANEKLMRALSDINKAIIFLLVLSFFLFHHNLSKNGNSEQNLQQNNTCGLFENIKWSQDLVHYVNIFYNLLKTENFAAFLFTDTINKEKFLKDIAIYKRLWESLDTSFIRSFFKNKTILYEDMITYLSKKAIGGMENIVNSTYNMKEACLATYKTLYIVQKNISNISRAQRKSYREFKRQLLKPLALVDENITDIIRTYWDNIDFQIGVVSYLSLN